MLINGKNGYQPGKISINGIAMGIKETNQDEEVEWLSGACVMHKRENIITSDFYPFSGKVYSEDVIHSFLLRKMELN